MASNKRYKYFILTGAPGCGKTILTRKIYSDIKCVGVKTSGFYTEEVTENGTSVGFDIITVDEERGRLARELRLLSKPVKHRVGKYGILTKEFEKVALPALAQAEEILSPEGDLVFIDEIGKMTLFSEPFKDAVRKVFDSSSNNIVLATIPLKKSDELIESIRNNRQAIVWTVTKDNRMCIYKEVLKEIRITINCPALAT